MTESLVPAAEGLPSRRWSERALTMVYSWLHGDPSSGPGRLIQGALQVLILVNIIALVVETIPILGERHARTFALVEQVSIVVFTVEYLARVLSSTAQGRFANQRFGRLRYALTPLALIDVVAIAPAYLPMFAGADLRGLRAVRLMRILRVLKLTRYSRAMKSLRAAVVSKKEELAVTGFGVIILLVLASSVLYLAERDAQPEAFGSIPAAAWWAVTTLTTVGYGDVSPITVGGKVAAGLVAIIGIGLFALPAGILGSALVDQVKHDARCPHCGKEL
ncbi:MAG TPA: ion transporter [Polyangiaceae bacterium]